MKGSELITKILERYGVTKVFGNPGTTELPFINSVNKSDKISYIMSLHEDIATGMSSGYSSIKRYRLPKTRLNEALSVVSLHVTPGLAHGLGNIYGAYYTGSPMIVTTGSQRKKVEERDPPLSGDRIKLVEEYTKWSKRVNDVDEIPVALKKAATIALQPPTGPVFLDFPISVQEDETQLEEEIPIGDTSLNPVDVEEVRRVSQILKGSNKPVIIVGNQLAHAGRKAVNNLIEIAERLEADVYGEPLLSEISIPTGHRLWSHILGLKQEDMEEYLNTDTILYVGCNTESPLFADDIDNLTPDYTDKVYLNYTDRDVYNERNTLIHGSITQLLDTLRLHLNDVNRVQDSNLEPPEPNIPNSAERPSSVNVANTIDNNLGENILVEEAVTAGFVLRNLANLDYGQLIAQKSGGLGYGLPASVGVAIAEEERQNPRNVICYVGDGSYQYYPQSLYSANRYVSSSLSVIVAENGGYEILRNSDVIDDKSESTDKSLSFDTQGKIMQNARSYGLNSELFNPQEDNIDEVLDSVMTSDEVKLLELPISS